MFTYCGQVQVQRLANGIVQMTFLTHPGGEIIAQIAVALSDAESLRNVLTQTLEAKIETTAKH